MNDRDDQDSSSPRYVVLSPWRVQPLGRASSGHWAIQSTMTSPIISRMRPRQITTTESDMTVARSKQPQPDRAEQPRQGGARVVVVVTCKIRGRRTQSWFANLRTPAIMWRSPTFLQRSKKNGRTTLLFSQFRPFTALASQPSEPLVFSSKLKRRTPRSQAETASTALTDRRGRLSRMLQSLAPWNWASWHPVSSSGLRGLTWLAEVTFG